MEDLGKVRLAQTCQGANLLHFGSIHKELSRRRSFAAHDWVRLRHAFGQATKEFLLHLHHLKYKNNIGGGEGFKSFRSWLIQKGYSTLSIYGNPARYPHSLLPGQRTNPASGQI